MTRLESGVVLSMRVVAGIVVLLALLVSGCAQQTGQGSTGAQARSAEPTGSAARQVTLIYTGYGRGVVDPQAAVCT